MKSTIAVLLCACLAIASGCAPAPKSGQGFTLPDGDATQGKATYISLKCNACHSISGVDQLVTEGESPAVSVQLGGKVPRIKTYGELVTSIINPSHRLANGYVTEAVSVQGQSKMTNYNDVMTVKQLTDLVAFLQSKYEIQEYEPTVYPMWGP